MSPAAASAEWDGAQQDRRVSKLVFFLFVSGAALLCAGVLLSIFGFQACQPGALPHCGTLLKVAGPACAALGLGAVVLARSRARLQRRERRRRGGRVDPDRAFACGESRQFAQCLVFGFLFLTSGMLMSILGIWVPGCSPAWGQDQNDTDAEGSEPRICGFLSLQILGPLIVLVGLCFFVVAHVKKRSSLNAGQEAYESDEREAQNTEPVQVTVGDSVVIFPPPPPPYFPEEASAGTPSPGPVHLLPSEDPPSYHSIFNYGRTAAPEGPGATRERDQDSIYTITGTPSFSDSSHAPRLSAEPPPLYEEKEAAGTTSPLPAEPALP
ncbi:transmembrane protein 171 isoform X2 [Erinaceus europaeus]|nr:transmembrane protein 171 isoform X2 [Erinaceus europaeus]